MKQLNLFDEFDKNNRRRVISKEKKLTMDRDALIKWKSRIYNHQQKVREQYQPIQQSLFDLPKTTWSNPDEINPFELKLHPADFYRKPDPPQAMNDDAQGRLYFVIDNVASVLLYIGETKLTARERWIGTHYCKEYTLNYIETHRRFGLDVAVCAAFWVHVPSDKKILLQWERELIFKWCPPFNKEMWEQFGQPFGKQAY